MFFLKLSEMVGASGGALIQGMPDIGIKSVSIDTRTIKRGDFFIPLKGEKFNGHQFIKDALKKSASGFFTENWDKGDKDSLKDLLNDEIAVIKVDDTLKALQGLARFVREKLSCEVIGITGSTGKTCTKDMMASIFLRVFKTVSTEKNYNNEIGVPLTLLKADKNTEVIVLEMAMRGKEQIRELAEIAKPTVGLVTNIGESHYEMLNSLMNIAKTKRELVESIPYDGKVILNLDDRRFKMFARKSKAKIVTFGFSRWANYFPLNIKIDTSGFYSFEMMTPKGSILINLPVVGKHNIYNALAASAAAAELGVSLSDIKAGLENCQVSEMRMQFITSSGEIIIINDAYNASPDSMRAALSTLSEITGFSHKFAVLGDMLELGEISETSHYEVGKFAGKSDIDFLITVGDKAKQIAKGAIKSGFNRSRIFAFNNSGEAIEILLKLVEKGDIVLVKASRAMGLEKVVEALLERVKGKG